MPKGVRNTTTRKVKKHTATVLTSSPYYNDFLQTVNVNRPKQKKVTKTFNFDKGEATNSANLENKSLMEEKKSAEYNAVGFSRC